MPVYDTLLSTSNTLTIGLLLITFYSLPALILAYTSYIAYRQSKHQELLHPMTAALIPFIAVATLTLATPLKPSKADDYIPLPGRILLLYLQHLAPLTGTLLWTTIGLAFLRLKKTLDLAGGDPGLEPRPAHHPANPTH
jgi:tellurite resistance protein TehA-like permease